MNSQPNQAREEVKEYHAEQFKLSQCNDISARPILKRIVLFSLDGDEKNSTIICILTWLQQ